MIFSKYNEIARDVLKEYSSKTTIHGVHYVNEAKTSLFERVWWIVVLITSIIICGIFIYQIWAKWNRSPVIVTFASKTTPITEVVVLTLINNFEKLSF